MKNRGWIELEKLTSILYSGRPERRHKVRIARHEDHQAARRGDQRNARGALPPRGKSWRLDLARFLFSRGHTTDALGLLQIIIEDDEELLADRSVRGMRGGARFLTNNLDGAAEDLFHEALDDEPEISIWRGALSPTHRNRRAAVPHI